MKKYNVELTELEISLIQCALALNKWQREENLCGNRVTGSKEAEIKAIELIENISDKLTKIIN